MKKNSYQKVKILESGEIIKIDPKYKYKKVISKNGNEYLRATNAPSWEMMFQKKKN